MMLRMFVGVARTIGTRGKLIKDIVPPNVVFQLKTCNTLRPYFQSSQQWTTNRTSLALLARPLLFSDGIIQQKIPNLIQPQVRTVTKFSARKGKRKTVKAVVKRFYRLSWGGWIRTRAGRFKRLWKKRESLKLRYRQHVFCNARQCTLLDKMVTKYWKRRRYYVDDPYEPYHTREEFPNTRRKPQPAPPR